MSRHDGVSCDGCDQQAFRGRRFKCLRCFDFDLCGPCYDSRNFNEEAANAGGGQHRTDHPMQCILTRTDMLLFFGGESASAAVESGAVAFTCPYCGQPGYSLASLADHVAGEHSDSASSSLQVICPVCAASPSGAPNHQTRNLVNHLQFDHAPSMLGIDDPALASAGGGSGHPAGLRTRDACRRQMPSFGRGTCLPVRTPVPASGSGSTRGRGMVPSSMIAAGGGRGLMASSMSGSGGGVERFAWSLSSDPIAELLNQLSSVRSRPSAAAAAAVSSQLAQLELQLQSTRAQLERLPSSGGRSGASATLADFAVAASSGVPLSFAGYAAAAAGMGQLPPQDRRAAAAAAASASGHHPSGLRLKAAAAAAAAALAEQQQQSDAASMEQQNMAAGPVPLPKDKYPLLSGLLAEVSGRGDQQLAAERAGRLAALLLISLAKDSGSLQQLAA